MNRTPAASKACLIARFAQYAPGARVANDVLGLIADLIRSLDVIEQTITGGKP